MRYRIEKTEIPLEEASGESSETQTVLKTSIWPQPFCFDKTPDEKKSAKVFDFSPEGLSLAVDWLNERYINEKNAGHRIEATPHPVPRFYFLEFIF